MLLNAVLSHVVELDVAVLNPGRVFAGTFLSPETVLPKQWIAAATKLPGLA
jgi:hypothetical protein